MLPTVHLVHNYYVPFIEMQIKVSLFFNISIDLNKDLRTVPSGTLSYYTNISLNIT